MAWMFGIGNTQYNNGARSKLQSLDVSNFNTSNVTNMEGMFQYLELIPELDVSGFNTSNVENMQTMFQRCEKITSLDLSNFDTSKVTTMGWMFYGDNNLVGGNGATYNSSKRDKTYARIDKEETPGYFTLKSAS